VLPFMNTAGLPVHSGVSMADETKNALVNLGIPTLERARTVEIPGEQLRQLSLVHQGGDASRVGKLLGAATLVTGRLIDNADKRKVTTLSIRLLHVRTTEHGKAATFCDCVSGKAMILPASGAVARTTSGR
jgi:hypothetical protein